MFAETRLKEIARGGIERCCDWGEEASADDIYSDAYDAAFDALVEKASCDISTARTIADQVAREFAQP